MLTKIAQMTTADGDTVTLFRTDERFGTPGDPAPHNFDGHRRRYVFRVEGKGASGWGAVGGTVQWKGTDGRREVDAWEPGSLPVVSPWADANTWAADGAEYAAPVVIRGAEYGYGYHWVPALPASGMAWRIDHAGLQRQNGTMTDAGRSRVSHVLEAARDLFLSLPDVETELTRNSLRGAIERQNEIVRKAARAAVRMTDRMNAL